MDTQQVSLSGPFLSLQASRVIPHLLASDEVAIDGLCFCPDFDAGMAAFPALGITGYIWPYIEEGKSVNDPPDIWFALPRFRVPKQWLDRFLKLQSGYQIRLTEDSDDRWEVREQPLSEHIMALAPQHPDEASNELLQTWRQDNAREFLLLGGLNPDEATVLMSNLPIPEPLF